MQSGGTTSKAADKAAEFIWYLRDARRSTPHIFAKKDRDAWMLREVTLMGMGVGHYELAEPVAKIILLMDLWENDLDRQFDDPEFMCYLCQARQAHDGLTDVSMLTVATVVAYYLSLPPHGVTMQ